MTISLIDHDHQCILTTLCWLFAFRYPIATQQYFDSYKFMTLGYATVYVCFHKNSEVIKSFSINVYMASFEGPYMIMYTSPAILFFDMY